MARAASPAAGPLVRPGMTTVLAPPSRLVYLGTPEMAVPPLRALVDAGFDVALVVAAPDRRAGPGGRAVAEPGQGRRPRAGPAGRPSRRRRARRSAPTSAWSSRSGGSSSRTCSPRCRWSTCTSRCCRDGGARPRSSGRCSPATSVTGVCIMDVEEGLDTGGVYARAEVPIGPDTTADELRSRAGRGRDAAPRRHAAARARRAGAAERRGRPTRDKIDPSELEIDWARPVGRDRPARARRRRVDHVPTDARLKVWRAALDGDGRRRRRGSLAGHRGDGGLRLVEVQPEGKGRMAAADWARARRRASARRRSDSAPMQSPPPRRSPSTALVRIDAEEALRQPAPARSCSSRADLDDARPGLRHQPRLRHDAHAPRLRLARRRVRAARARPAGACRAADRRVPARVPRHAAARRGGRDRRRRAEAGAGPRQRGAPQGRGRAAATGPTTRRASATRTGSSSGCRPTSAPTTAIAALDRDERAGRGHRAGRRLRAGPRLPARGRGGGRRARATVSSTCAPRRAARPPASRRAVREVVALDLRPGRARPGRRQRGAARSAGAGGRGGRRSRARRCAPARPTGCSSTPRARASARFAAGPMPAGASTRRRWTGWPVCRPTCSTRRPSWSGPAARSATPCARSPERSRSASPTGSAPTTPGFVPLEPPSGSVGAVGEREPAPPPDRGHRRHGPLPLGEGDLGSGRCERG